MGTNELRKRAIWQDKSGFLATKAEHTFYNVFDQSFKNTNFSVRANPQEFNKIYVDFPLLKEVKKEIYTPEFAIKKHGITPDYAIDHIESKKTLYVEVKRQDGWVEGKPRSAGRGNAHERSCKYFTPGLLKILRKESGINNNSLPFWTVFIGDISRDPCRVREVTCWFDDFADHFFFWRDMSNPNSIIDHFDLRLKHLLY
tara:strand:+ start:121 stop:720 length:600 start_codon:yes stop_codon:yes gene_type:complete